jgi:hypothetical protein
MSIHREAYPASCLRSLDYLLKTPRLTGYSAFARSSRRPQYHGFKSTAASTDYRKVRDLEMVRTWRWGIL